MTRIGSKTIDTAQDQSKITFTIAGTEYWRISGTGQLIDSTYGGTARGFAGGTAAITAASAATAGSTSALSAFTIAHGLGTTPTVFGVQPANSQAALAEILGSFTTADATNVYYKTASSVTASAAYSFQWFAAP